MSEAPKSLVGIPLNAFSVHRLNGAIVFIPATILLVAGLFKLHQFLTVSPYVMTSGLIPSQYIVPVAIVEIVLALHLLLHKTSAWAWTAAVLIFTVFLGINTVLILHDVPNCECFGRLSPSPAIALGLNIISLAGLICFGLTNSVLRSHVRGAIKPRPRTILIASIVLLATLPLFSPDYRDAIFDYVDPSRTITARASPDILLTGSKELDDLTVIFENRTSDPVTILGKQGRCGIHFQNAFPMTIPPMDHASVKGFVSINKAEGKYSVPAVLVTDSSSVPFIVVKATVSISSR